MTEEVRQYLAKADHALIVAEELLAHGHLSDAASKTYYAMFYAAKALLTAEGITFPSIRRLNQLWGTTLRNRAAWTRACTGCS